MKRGNKKAVSPVIATTLLIAMVIVLGLIIFLWIRGMSQEAVTKFDNKNIELVCQDLSVDDFKISYSSDTSEVVITNNGNIPIYDFEIQKISEEGDYETIKASEEFDAWPQYGLNTGKVFSGTIRGDFDELKFIPVLLGNSDAGEKTFTCDENTGRQIEA